MQQTARRLPGKPAIIDPQGNRELTYAEIDRESNILAAVLQGWGVRQGDRIGLFMANGWEYMVAFYGALKAGGVVSPINPTFREARVQYQINDAGSKILFAQENLLSPLEGIPVQTPTLEKIVLTRGEPGREKRFPHLNDILKRGSNSALRPCAIDPQKDLATLPYSSGTAGLNKGVMISHFNLVVNTIQSMRAIETREDDVLISFLPFNHIYGLTYFLCGAVYTGTTQVVMPRFRAEECLRNIEKYRATLMFSVPPALLELVNLPHAGNYDVSSLRYIWVGAAPLPGPVSEGIRRKFGIPVARHYGLSEASPTTHANPPDRPKDGSVGIAVSDLKDRIMDTDTGKEMPPGEPGELAVRGPNVFQGYWKHPEDTKLALRRGWLFTGDIARMDEEGYVYILDRKKEMIQYRGYRIAPAELESILMEHPAVRDCAVVGLPDKDAGEIPKAFVVLQPQVEVEPEDLIDFVAERVPEYKQIREVALIPEVPKNASGKILRRVLKAG